METGVLTAVRLGGSDLGVEVGGVQKNVGMIDILANYNDVFTDFPFLCPVFPSNAGPHHEYGGLYCEAFQS